MIDEYPTLTIGSLKSYFEDRKYLDFYDDFDVDGYGLNKGDCRELIDIFKALQEPPIYESPMSHDRPRMAGSESSHSRSVTSSSNKRTYDSDNVPGVYVLRLRGDATGTHLLIHYSNTLLAYLP